MHLSKGLFLGLLSIVLGCAPLNRNTIPKSYDVTPVLLYATSAKQADSIGFNIVQGIAELLYPRILTGDIPLWEHSSKKLIVGPTQMQKMEKRAARPFVSGTDIFIHEYWQLFKRNFDFVVKGISFIGSEKDGTIINYGFIDGPDIISLLKSEHIATNASGPARLTYWDALHSNTFRFNLVQFGAHDFKKNPRMSPALQYQALHDERIFREFYALENTKQITYRVLSPRINSNNENLAFYTAIEKYVNANKQTILNAGGDAYFSHILLKRWVVENIAVKESWSKYKDLPLQNLDELVLFIDKHAITLTAEQLTEMAVQVNLQGLEEYLSEKRFDFLLEQINNQEIQPQKSELFYKALLSKPWNKINY
jgi:hypothetical protein